jgi:hypothetical protein
LGYKHNGSLTDASAMADAYRHKEAFFCVVFLAAAKAAEAVPHYGVLSFLYQSG